MFSSPVQNVCLVFAYYYTYLGFHVFVLLEMMIVVLVEDNNFLITDYSLPSICACELSYKK